MEFSVKGPLESKSPCLQKEPTCTCNFCIELWSISFDLPWSLGVLADRWGNRYSHGGRHGNQTEGNRSKDLSGHASKLSFNLVTMLISYQLFSYLAMVTKQKQRPVQILLTSKLSLTFNILAMAMLIASSLKKI